LSHFLPDNNQEQRGKVSKLTVGWLTALLALSIIFAGHAEAKAVFEQRQASVTVVAPLLVSSPLHSTDANSFPMVPDIIIPNPLADCAPGPYWTRPNDYQRQIYGITRTGHGGMPLGTGRGCKFAQHEQQELAIHVSSSGSLSSLSPPDLILRL